MRERMAVLSTLLSKRLGTVVTQAKLVPIPEGYKPKEYEYYKNPISRLMMKYCKPFGLQQEYEMNMHGVWEGVKIAEMRALKKEVHRQMQIHGDYKGWYHREDIARYARIQREGDRLTTEQRGNHFVGHDHTPK